MGILFISKKNATAIYYAVGWWWRRRRTTVGKYFYITYFFSFRIVLYCVLATTFTMHPGLLWIGYIIAIITENTFLRSWEKYCKNKTQMCMRLGSETLVVGFNSRCSGKEVSNFWFRRLILREQWGFWLWWARNLFRLGVIGILDQDCGVDYLFGGAT